jgi:general secretion pathway protein G
MSFMHYLQRSSRTQGFTIVELLIVIVVIAILAAVSIVAYNGVVERAENNQTVSAVRAYATALKLYSTDEGEYPNMASCLGADYDPVDGRDCRRDSASYGINTSTSFNNLMSEYLGGNFPMPSYTAVYPWGSEGWRRGAYFYPDYTGSPNRIDFVLMGASTDCPTVAGMTLRSQNSDAGTDATACTVAFED